VKPLRIELSNIGPFTQHDVDLEPFRDEGLFLIHGDTGAGKSTLLDAMSFALYGRGLGARSGEELLRNRAARPDVPTRAAPHVLPRRPGLPRRAQHRVRAARPRRCDPAARRGDAGVPPRRPLLRDRREPEEGHRGGGVPAARRARAVRADHGAPARGVSGAAPRPAPRTASACWSCSSARRSTASWRSVCASSTAPRSWRRAARAASVKGDCWPSGSKTSTG
jgi:hypothetical protein